ncbi:DUF1792 domain-containing protein [Faecalicatena fissicatena]|jgi:glycosyltransferase family protein|uniref:GT-D fold domain-containing glycosyltransferase n=1 Tax=Faecalicatena fissicatena TaxID=290055 RepID=UPI0015708C6C|nr:GT-D fold domain-containing glycosyltransferase [Faecalicatena fissicatena]NSD75371.1 DUF1792 domain-containing protein [Faecalicatena fissicatena]
MKYKDIKQILANLYNYFYDRKLDIELFIRWRKDLSLQKKIGVPLIMSIDETLDKIMKDKCSVCRYGDGEFKLMDGDKIFFQEGNENLGKRLREVIYSNQDNILICIPTFLDRRHPVINMNNNLTLTREEKKRKKNALKYMDNILAERRSQWYKYFDMKRLYGNSLVSRFYAEVYDDQKSAGWIEKWKKIWSGRKLLIVEGELTRLGVGNDLFDDVVNIRRVLCPSKSAFSVYDKILRNVLEVHEKEELILIALGPTATILAYDLAEKGVQALDVGHIDIEYEWFLRKDRTHKKIEGKFVSEAQGGSEVSAVKEQAYVSQIVMKIENGGR